MIKKVRVAVVGLGAQGRFYAELVAAGRAPSLSLAALCGPNPASTSSEKHQQFADELGVQLFTDLRQLLDSRQVDAIVITTPHYEHPRIGIEALRAGIHVLVEKPVGVYTKQVEDLLQVADQHPELTLAVMFNQRTNPLYAELKQAIDSGSYGRLRHSTWQITHWWRPDAYFTASPWRASWGGEGGGVLINQAQHQLDLWQWLCGTVERCFARVQFGFRRDIPVDDEVHALVQFSGGASGSFLTSTNDLVGTDRLELLFDRAKIVIDDSANLTIWDLVDDERTIARTLHPTDAAKVASEGFDRSQFYHVHRRHYSSAWGEQHALVLENFGRHLLDGTPLVADGREGINSVRLANAMHLSAWTNQDIDLTRFDGERYLSELNARIAAEGRFPPRS